MTYYHSKHETCIVMVGTCMYNCPTFFLFWECLDDMSYWTILYRTVADNELHFFTISNLNYTVFVSLAHMILFMNVLFSVILLKTNLHYLLKESSNLRHINLQEQVSGILLTMILPKKL